MPRQAQIRCGRRAVDAERREPFVSGSFMFHLFVKLESLPRSLISAGNFSAKRFRRYNIGRGNCERVAATSPA
jgi:hypothetical protein